MYKYFFSFILIVGDIMKERIVSAIVMILIFVPLLLIGHLPFACFMTFLSMLGLYELIHMRESKKEFPFLLKIFAYLLVAFFSLLNYKQNVFTSTIDFRTVTFIIFAFLLPMIFIKKRELYELNDALFLVGAVLFIGLSFNLFILIRNYDLNYFIYLLLVTVITDTFAMITGKYIGVNPLCPKISPHKTIEGLIGGVLTGTFVAATFYHVVIQPAMPLIPLILFTILLSIIGQMGDLVFSSIKRNYKMKDFSNLIPGHGGILDRLDSFIFVSLAFVLLVGIL